jgi:hypothetical protein
MATYIPGVQGYYPDFEPFVPDYKFLSGVLDQRTDRYNTNYKAINDLYGKVVYADLTRDDSIEMRDQYANLLAPKLEQVASMDLSLQQNADAAKALFQPFYDNNLIVKDLVTTQQYKKELGYANSLLESDDQKTREKYWQTGVEALQYQLQDFKTAEPDKALSMGLPKYVPDADLYEMSLELLNKSGLSVGPIDSVDPNDPHKTWIITQKNGSLVTPIAFETVKRTLLDDPRVINAYYTDAYVKSRKFADQGMESGQFATVDEGRTAWANNIIADIQAKTLKKNEKTKQNVKESEAVKNNWEQYANKNGIIPGSDEDKAMIEALAKYDGEMSKLESENNILKESQDPAPSDQNLISKAYNLLMSYNISDDMMAAAQQYSMKDASLTFKPNPYREMELKFAHDFALEDVRFKNDAKLKQLEHDNDKKLEDYKNRFKSSLLGLFSSALTGNERTTVGDKDGDGKLDTDADLVEINKAAKGSALKNVTDMQLKTIADAHMQIEGMKGKDGKPYEITVDTKDGKKPLNMQEFFKVMSEPGNEPYRAQLYNKYREQIDNAPKTNPNLYNFENNAVWQKLKQGFKATDDKMAAVVDGSKKEVEVYKNNLANAAETEGGKAIKELQKRGIPSIITSPLKQQLQNQEDLSEADKSKRNAIYLGGANTTSKLLTREEYRDQFRRAYQLGKIKDEDNRPLKNLGTSLEPSQVQNARPKKEAFSSSTLSWLGSYEIKEDVQTLADKAYDAQMKVLNASLTGAIVPTKTQEGKPTGTFKTFGFDQWMRGMAVDEMTTGNLTTYPVYKQFIDPYTVIQDEKAAGMLSDFLTQYNASPNAVVVKGDLTGASETPTVSEDIAKKILGQALQDMAAAIASSDDKSKAKETSPYFTIKYAPVYGSPSGGKENAAYVIEFNNDYIKKFAGGDESKTYITNEDVPEYSKMTMLFPRETDVSSKNSESYNFSGIQNRIQSSPEGRYTYSNPAGGSLTVFPSGNNWLYNMNTLVYDSKSGNFVMQDVVTPTPLTYPDGTPVKRNDLDRVVGGLEQVLNGISTENIKAQDYYKKNYFNNISRNP